LDSTPSRASVAPARRLSGAALGRALPLFVLGATLLGLFVAPHGPSERIPDAAILIAFAIASWAFGLFAEPVTSLVFLLLGVLFHVAKPAVLFSGFVSQAWWLVFGGAITAVAVETTGLGQRLAGLLFGRMVGAYWRCVTAVALAAVGLAFVMPSTNGRVLLLIPIVLAFAERLELPPGGPGHTGLILTLAAASYMPPTTILPANVPNSILLGAAESLYGVKLSYGPYLLLHFPILGALKTVLLIWLICRLFPERRHLVMSGEAERPPMSREERRLAVILVLSLLLYMTDFIHGISPAWISLGTGIFCLMPPFGMLTPKTFSTRVNVVTLIYIAGILGLGAVVADSGLGAAVSAKLLAATHVAPGRLLADLGILTAIGGALGLLTTLTGVPAVLTPLAHSFAAASGLPLLTVLMLQVIVFSTVFLPFSSPPMMIALQLGGVGIKPATKLTLALALLSILLLWPLDYFWWRLLGYLP
jgi:di/tricarboxylate transporter